MTTTLIYCRVADYDEWRPLYDRAFENIGEIRSYQLWRGQDDPNLVVMAETFDSRDVAESLFSSPEVQELMAADGVDMSSVQVHYLDDVGSRAR